MEIKGDYILKVAVVDQVQLDTYNKSNWTSFSIDNHSTNDLFLNIAERLGTVYSIGYYVGTDVKVNIDEALVRLLLVNTADHSITRVDEEDILEVHSAVLVNKPNQVDYRVEIVRGNILDYPDFALVDTFQHLDNAKEFAEDYAKDNNMSVCVKSFEVKYNEETKYYEEVESTEKLVYFVG